MPFWFNGQPKQAINPETAFPSGGKTYKGSGYLNSGTPTPGGPPAPFVVEFTKAGRFTFDCLIHPGMQGVVKVLPKGAHVPTVTKDHATALAEYNDAVAKGRLLGKIKLPAATVLARHDGSGPVAWLRFFPQNLKIKVGTTVNFKLSSQREIHTITLGPAAYTTAIEKTFTTPQPNPGGPPTLLVNPLGAFPSDPPPLPPYTGTNHGNGFEGTGVLAGGGGPGPPSSMNRGAAPRGSGRRQRTGGGDPSAVAASAGSQSHTLQACWNAERANSSACARASAMLRTSSQSRMYSPSVSSQRVAGGDSVAPANPSGAGWA
jgi:plastocyanin